MSNFAILSEGVSAHTTRRPRRNFTRTASAKPFVMPVVTPEEQAYSAASAALKAQIGQVTPTLGVKRVYFAKGVWQRGQAQPLQVLLYGNDAASAAAGRETLLETHVTGWTVTQPLAAVRPLPDGMLSGEWVADVEYRYTPRKRPAREQFSQLTHSGFAYGNALFHYAHDQAAEYVKTGNKAAANEVLWAVGMRYFPNAVINFAQQTLTYINFPTADVKQRALHTLSTLLPMFRVEKDANVIRLTTPPQGDLATPPDVTVLHTMLDAQALLDAVTRQTRCQDGEAMAQVNLMTGAELVDVLFAALPPLADEAWQDYAERLIGHAAALRNDLQAMIVNEIEDLPAASQPVEREMY